MHEKTRNAKAEGNSSIPCTRESNTVVESSANGSQTEGSEKEGSHSESSVDADSEASESENTSKQMTSSRACSTLGLHTDGHKHVPANIKLQHSKTSDSNTEALASSLLKLSVSNESEDPLNKDQLPSLSNNLAFSAENPSLLQNPQHAFQTLSQSYTTSSKECSVQSCLYQFTSVELLMGNNKLLCENCTEQKQKHQKKANSAGNVVLVYYIVSLEMLTKWPKSSALSFGHPQKGFGFVPHKVQGKLYLKLRGILV